MHAAAGLGGGADTVAAVSGGLPGAVHDAGAVPARWTDALHVPLPGWGGREPRSPGLTAPGRCPAAVTAP
nr:hypothetical protein StreXyl84_38950 [Streptomyces sp. Xyl84]